MQLSTVQLSKVVVGPDTLVRSPCKAATCRCRVRYNSWRQLEADPVQLSPVVVGTCEGHRCSWSMYCPTQQGDRWRQHMNSWHQWLRRQVVLTVDASRDSARCNRKTAGGSRHTAGSQSSCYKHRLPFPAIAGQAVIASPSGRRPFGLVGIKTLQWFIHSSGTIFAGASWQQYPSALVRITVQGNGFGCMASDFCAL